MPPKQSIKNRLTLAYWWRHRYYKRMLKHTWLHLDQKLMRVRKHMRGASSISQSAYDMFEREEKRYRLHSRIAKLSHAVPVTRQALLPFKKSDTLIILGGGPSINDLGPREWDFIAKHDSMGMTPFVMHSFIPTFYCAELIEHNLPLFRQCLLEKGSRALKIPVISNFLHLPVRKTTMIAKSFKHSMTLIPRQYNVATKPQLSELLQYWYTGDRFIQRDFVSHNRGSLSALLGLGVLMGYRSIVLAGIDLYSADYFFLQCPENYRSEARDEYADYVRNINRVRAKNNIHRTADPTLFASCLTITEIINIMNQAVCMPKGINLSLMSPKSLLAEFLPQIKMT